MQIWAHDVGNNTLLSAAISVAVANGQPAAIVPVPAPVAPVSQNYPIALTYPVSGQAVSGALLATASITQTLDAAGSYLMVDGQAISTRRVTNGPYAYAVDTSTLAPGTHQLQVWAHDVGNNNLLSNPVTIVVNR